MHRLLPIALFALLAACTAPRGSSAAPPLTVCGTVLSSGAAGAVLTDATGADTALTQQTVGQRIILRVAAGCQHGARLEIAPASAATLVGQARAKDGGVVAVAVHPRRSVFTIHIRQGADSRTVDVRLDQP